MYSKKIRDENHDVDLDNEARIKMRVHPDFTNTELKFEKTKFNNLKLGYKVEKNLDILFQMMKKILMKIY